MGNKIYVANLVFHATEADLEKFFSRIGPVQQVKLILDKLTGKSRGFAFITMNSDEDAAKAIAELNGKQYEGRALAVTEARPREDKPAGGGGGGFRPPGGGERKPYSGSPSGGAGSSSGGSGAGGNRPPGNRPPYPGGGGAGKKPGGWTDGGSRGARPDRGPRGPRPSRGDDED